MHSRERSLHHVPKLPGVGYPMSGFHGRSNALCRRSTTGVNRGASMQPIGECTEITDSGCSRSTRETRARVSGSHPGDFPGEREVSRSASRMERENTGAATQFVVAKLRFRSTPSAFPRVPRATPSGTSSRALRHGFPQAQGACTFRGSGSRGAARPARSGRIQNFPGEGCRVFPVRISSRPHRSR